jgi:hypothetical protein
VRTLIDEVLVEVDDAQGELLRRAVHLRYTRQALGIYTVVEESG